MQFPGPGTAMAFAAAVSIYSAAIVSDDFKIIFVGMTVVFIIATISIEILHSIILKGWLKKKGKIEE